MIRVRLSSVNSIIIKPIAEGYGQGAGPTVGFAGVSPAPPPPSGNIILLEDNVSYLMMEDNTSELLLEA